MLSSVYEQSMEELVSQALLFTGMNFEGDLDKFNIPAQYLYPLILQAGYIEQSSEACTSDYISNFPVFVDTIKKAPTVSKNGCTIKLISDLSMFPYTVSRALEMRDKASPEGCGGFTKGVLWEANDINAFEEALDILFQAIPEEAERLFVSNYMMLIFDLDKSIGFVDIASSGCIFIRKKELLDVYKLAENILHEGSHNLFNLWIVRNIPEIIEDQDLYVTPLRQDPRPIIGLLHQLYVLENLLLFWQSDRVFEHRDARETVEKLKAQIVACHEALSASNKWEYIKSIWPNNDDTESI